MQIQRIRLIPHLNRECAEGGIILLACIFDFVLTVGKTKAEKMTRLTADGYMHQVVIQSGSCLEFTLVTLLLFDRFS